jgi:hypothetical protein
VHGSRLSACNTQRTTHNATHGATHSADRHSRPRRSTVGGGAGGLPPARAVCPGTCRKPAAPGVGLTTGKPAPQHTQAIGPGHYKQRAVDQLANLPASEIARPNEPALGGCWKDPPAVQLTGRRRMLARLAGSDGFRKPARSMVKQAEQGKKM